VCRARPHRARRHRQNRPRLRTRTRTLSRTRTPSRTRTLSRTRKRSRTRTRERTSSRTRRLSRTSSRTRTRTPSRSRTWRRMSIRARSRTWAGARQPPRHRRPCVPPGGRSGRAPPDPACSCPPRRPPPVHRDVSVSRGLLQNPRHGSRRTGRERRPSSGRGPVDESGSDRSTWRRTASVRGEYPSALCAQRRWVSPTGRKRFHRSGRRRQPGELTSRPACGYGGSRSAAVQGRGSADSLRTPVWRAVRHRTGPYRPRPVPHLCGRTAADIHSTHTTGAHVPGVFGSRAARTVRSPHSARHRCERRTHPEGMGHREPDPPPACAGTRRLSDHRR
jgi:hypothetical protein